MRLKSTNDRTMAQHTKEVKMMIVVIVVVMHSKKQTEISKRKSAPNLF